MGEVPTKGPFSDYREVGGVKLPHELEADASLMTVTEKATKVEFSPDIDESKFAMPGAETEVVRGEDVQPAKKDTPMPFGPDGKPGRPVPEKKLTNSR